MVWSKTGISQFHDLVPPDIEQHVLQELHPVPQFWWLQYQPHPTCFNRKWAIKQWSSGYWENWLLRQRDWHEQRGFKILPDLCLHRANNGHHDEEHHFLNQSSAQKRENLESWEKSHLSRQGRAGKLERYYHKWAAWKLMHTWQLKFIEEYQFKWLEKLWLKFIKALSVKRHVTVPTHSQ